jgi:Mitochondrial carrier protein
MKSPRQAHSSSSGDAENISLFQSTIDLNDSSGRDEIPKLRHEGIRDRKHVYSALVAGLTSGAISAAVCAPLDLVRTRMQVMGEIVENTTKHEHRSLKDQVAIRMIQDIIQKDGLVGCFRGLTATLLTVPAFWGVYCKYYTSDQSTNLIGYSST